MIRSERSQFIISELEDLYPKTPVPLNHNSDFELLIAVLLSAQCTDERVNKVTPILFEEANNPNDMAKVPVEKIYSIIRPCGLAPKKSKAISELSQIIMSEYKGEVPRTFKQLEKLPGVGHKTASVVMAQAFDIPAFPVDTHIHRLAQRWGLTNGKNVSQTESDLKKIFPRKLWNKLHLQIIFYGREYCTARGCDGTICKICRTCFPKRRKPFKALKA